MAKLIFIDKALDGRVYELTGEKTTVGRSSDNTLAIRDSSISGKHCEILVYGPEVIVRDLGSRNGTFVNGKRLANEQWQLKAGQIVRFGSVKARLEMDEPVSEDFDTLSLAEIEKFITEEKRPAAPDAHVVLAGESPPAETAHTIHLAAPSLAEGKES